MAVRYVPREQFVPFHNRRQRWAVLNTHRRAGKTVAVVNDLIVGALECQRHRPQLAYVGPTYSQAKKVAWQYLKEHAEPYFARAPSEAELKITLKNDAVIYVLGADNADSLRGIYLDGGTSDEYAMFKPSVFSQVIRPALSDRLGWWVFTSTPKGKNLFYEVTQEARKDPANWYSLTLSAEVSGIIPPHELEALRRDMDPEEFAQEYLCSFDLALKGAIYADEINDVFVEKRIDVSLMDPNLRVHVAFDLGFTDATVGIFWQEDREGWIRIVGVEVTTGQNIHYHIDKLLSYPGELGDIWLPHDARAKSLQTGRSVIEQFLQADLRPRLVPMHKVRDRIAATRRLMPKIRFEEAVTSDLLEALKGYRREWDDRLLMFSDHPLHDWCSDYADAFGYMCMVAAPRHARVGNLSSDMRKRADDKDSTSIYIPDMNLHNLHADREDMLRRTRARIK